jgi:hypothetical protein
MRKKAKFVIEIEYEAEEKGMDTSNIKIIQCDAEGDYKGLTLALTTGLAFASEKGRNPKEIFAEKLRLLRSTGSALMNMIQIVKNQGEIGEELEGDLEEGLAAAIKYAVNLISMGVGNILGISNEYVEELNNEYTDAVNDNKTDKDGKDGQKGTGQSSYEDFL